MIPRRVVPVYTSWMRNVVVVIFASVLGCGGGVAESPAEVANGLGGPGDVMFEIATVDLKSSVPEPRALGTPGVPIVEGKKKTTIEDQRALYASSKDVVQKQAQAAILATMLYVKSKDAVADEKTALLRGARDVLREAAVAAGSNVDELTLRLLGSYELMTDDYVAAEKVWRALVEGEAPSGSGKAARRPTAKDATLHRAWWVYSLLRSHRNADALAALGNQPVSQKLPEFAYVAGWAKWRAGDAPGAWSAIVAAASGWGIRASRETLEQEVRWFAATAGPPVAEALPQLTAFMGDRQYEVVAKLGLQSYPLAGRWADAIAAIDAAVALGPGKVPAGDLPLLALQQAEYTIRLDDPVSAAERAKLALTALSQCGAACRDGGKTDVVDRIYLMGRLFHVLYATAHDDRYYSPAHDLYAAAIPLLPVNGNVREQATRDAINLEGSHRAMTVGSGAHDKAAIGALLAYRNQEVQACYERGLAANPKLGGTLVVFLESDQSGAIKGATTEPPVGASDMAQVAGCVLERARTWTLPKRANGTGPTGITRIKLSYSMSLASPAR